MAPDAARCGPFARRAIRSLCRVLPRKLHPVPDAIIARREAQWRSVFDVQRSMLRAKKARFADGGGQHGARRTAGEVPGSRFQVNGQEEKRIPGQWRTTRTPGFGGTCTMPTRQLSVVSCPSAPLRASRRSARGRTSPPQGRRASPPSGGRKMEAQGVRHGKETNAGSEPPQGAAYCGPGRRPPQAGKPWVPGQLSARAPARGGRRHRTLLRPRGGLHGDDAQRWTAWQWLFFSEGCPHLDRPARRAGKRGQARTACQSQFSSGGTGTLRPPREPQGRQAQGRRV
jgi:hypothetical protein